MAGQDGTQTQTDITSSTVAQTSEIETYTKKQVEEQVRKVRSDTLAEVGRLRKSSEDALRAANAANERLARLQKEQEEAELEAVRDQPDAIAHIRTKQALRQKDAELAQAREELNSAKTTLTELQAKQTEASREQVTREIASKLGVDPSRLAKLAKFTDGTAEQIEDIAKDLPKVTPGKQSFQPDSNISNGGGASWEEVRAAFIKNPRSPGVKKRYLEMKQEQGG